MSTTLALNLTEGTGADLRVGAAPAVANVSAPPPAPALACPSQSPRRRKAGTAVALSLVLRFLAPMPARGEGRVDLDPQADRSSADPQRNRP